jgi:predicted nuclease of predicted toxin-antitoxin system
MRLLLDENLPVSLAALLESRVEWDVRHVRDLGMMATSDVRILAHAKADDRILVSADTDFGGLLAASGARGPSVVLLRLGSGRRAEVLASLLMTNIPVLAEDRAVESCPSAESERPSAYKFG